MHLKAIIQGLAAIWLVVFAVSFFSLRGGESDDFASVLSRVVVFLTWQVVAFAVAAAGALGTRRAVARETPNVKLIGYGPLAISVFVVAAFIVIVAVRFLLVPLLESSGLL